LRGAACADGRSCATGTPNLRMSGDRDVATLGSAGAVVGLRGEHVRWLRECPDHSNAPYTSGASYERRGRLDDGGGSRPSGAAVLPPSNVVGISRNQSSWPRGWRTADSPP